MASTKKRKIPRSALIGGAVGLLVLAGIVLCVLLMQPKQSDTPKRTFTVGFDAEFPPYGYKDDNGEYQGFDLDLAQEVCKRKGWTLKKQPIDWDAKDMELNSGAIDCIWNGFTINGRENDYTWSEPYIDNSQVIVVKKDSDIQKPADLKGKTVVVQADSSALAAFTGDDASDENKALAASFAKLQEVPDYNTAFLNLESGMVQAVCMDVGVANFQLHQRGDSFRILPDSISTEKYGVGFKKGNTALRDEVQQVLYDMAADGTLKSIAEKYDDFYLADSLCLEAPDENDAGRTFTVGFDADFPPYGYKSEDGEYTGFDLDLAQEVCKRRGWTLKKQPIDWDAKDMELNSGAIDCIWNGFTINGREELYTWTVPYIDNSQVIVVRSDSDIQKPADLKGKVVIVQKDSSALAAFTGDDATDENKALKASFAELQEVSDYNSAFLDLESGMAQAICMDSGVANYQMQKRGDTFRILKDTISTEKYGVGFKKGNTSLRNKVQATLFEMKADGTLEEIARNYGDFYIADSLCLDEKDAGKVNADSTSKKSSDINYGAMFSQLAEGMGASLLIFVLTLLFALPLGLLLTFVRMSRFRILQWIAKIYISIMRGTPLMLQLLVVCYGPYYLFRIPLAQEYRFYAVIIGFSLNYAAYFAEIFRAGIQAVPVGQREAAAVLGYSRSQTFRKIIFPQMIKNVLPPVTNEVITLVKDTSLAFVLAYTEMFTIAKQIAAAQANIIPLFAAGLFYFVFNFIVAVVMSRIEKKLSYYK